MQFLVIGLDGDDDKALDRRMAVRGNHIALGDELLASGNMWYGAAILKPDGSMGGSALFMDFKNEEELFNRYKGLMTDLKRLIPLGLSAAVYTQTTDVEIETNGIMTYDRKKVKMPERELKQQHDALYK